MADIKVKRFKQESTHRQTDTRTHTDATKSIVSPAMQSINTVQLRAVSIVYAWELMFWRRKYNKLIIRC